MSNVSAGLVRYYQLNLGYAPAEQVRPKLDALISRGVVLKRLAVGIGIDNRALYRIHRGIQHTVSPAVATAIHDLDIETAVDLYGPITPYADPVVVDRIISGQSVTVDSVDKPEYARVLHNTHGWTKTRIANRLGISGARINQHLGAAA